MTGPEMALAYVGSIAVGALVCLSVMARRMDTVRAQAEANRRLIAELRSNAPTSLSGADAPR